MTKYIVEITLNPDSNEPEFYDFLHQWLSYDKRIERFKIKKSD